MEPKKLPISLMPSYLNSSLKYSLFPSWAFTSQKMGPTAILLRDCPPPNGSQCLEIFHDAHHPASSPEFLHITPSPAVSLGEIILPSPSVPPLPDFHIWLSGAPSKPLLSQALHIQFFSSFPINQSLQHHNHSWHMIYPIVYHQHVGWLSLKNVSI